MTALIAYNFKHGGGFGVSNCIYIYIYIYISHSVARVHKVAAANLRPWRDRHLKLGAGCTGPSRRALYLRASWPRWQAV